MAGRWLAMTFSFSGALLRSFVAMRPGRLRSHHRPSSSGGSVDRRVKKVAGSSIAAPIHRWGSWRHRDTARLSRRDRRQSRSYVSWNFAWPRWLSDGVEAVSGFDERLQMLTASAANRCSTTEPDKSGPLREHLLVGSDPCGKFCHVNVPLAMRFKPGTAQCVGPLPLLIQYMPA